MSWGFQAAALECATIVDLYRATGAEADVAAMVSEAGDRHTVEDVVCLEKEGVPDVIVNAVAALVGFEVPEPIAADPDGRWVVFEGVDATTEGQVAHTLVGELAREADFFGPFALGYRDRPETPGWVAEQPLSRRIRDTLPVGSMWLDEILGEELDTQAALADEAALAALADAGFHRVVVIGFSEEGGLIADYTVHRTPSGEATDTRHLTFVSSEEEPDGVTRRVLKALAARERAPVAAGARERRKVERERLKIDEKVAEEAESDKQLQADHINDSGVRDPKWKTAIQRQFIAASLGGGFSVVHSGNAQLKPKTSTNTDDSSDEVSRAEVAQHFAGLNTTVGTLVENAPFVDINLGFDGRTSLIRWGVQVVMSIGASKSSALLSEERVGDATATHAFRADFMGQVGISWPVGPIFLGGGWQLGYSLLTGTGTVVSVAQSEVAEEEPLPAVGERFGYTGAAIAHGPVLMVDFLPSKSRVGVTGWVMHSLSPDYRVTTGGLRVLVLLK